MGAHSASSGKGNIASARAARKMGKKRELVMASANFIATNGLKPGTHTRRGIVQADRTVRALY